MSLLDPRPGPLEFLLQIVRLIGEHRPVRQQIEQAATLPGDRRIKLPSRKHRDPARAHRLLNYFFVSTDPFAGKAYMNRAQQIFAHRRLRERQKQGFVQRARGTLRSRIKLADGLDLIAEELDAHGSVSLGRVHIEDPAAQGVLAGHLDHVGRVVAHGVQVLEQRLGVERLAAADRARQVGVVLRRSQPDGRRRNGSDHQGDRTGGNLPQRRSPLFLNLRVRGKILERQHVARGQGDDRSRLGGPGEFRKSLQHRHQVLGGAVVRYHHDQRPPTAFLEKNQEQGFGGRRQSGHTDAPGTLFDMGGYA